MKERARPAVIAVVGAHNSGKTTLIERLIPILRRKGFRVGSVKHTCHEDFEIDNAGSDSYRHRKAGSERVAISSEAKTILLKEVRGPLQLDEVLELFDSEDLVLVEGYKGSILPKIEVFQGGEGGRPLADRDQNVIAIYSRTPLLSSPHFRGGRKKVGGLVSGKVPVFSNSELEGLIELVEGEMRRQRWPFRERMN